MEILTYLTRIFTKGLSLWHWAQQRWDYKINKKFNDLPIKEWICFWKKYSIDGAYEDMNSKELSQEGVHAYLRHIPIRGYNGDWPEEIYSLTESCVQKLYEYSKERKFIQEDFTFEDFLKSHGYNPCNCPITKQPK